MANYLSRPYQIQQPVSRGNIGLDFQVLNTLQSRYDANKAIVDQAMSQYEMLKGIRETDNQYIAAKVAEAKAAKAAKEAEAAAIAQTAPAQAEENLADDGELVAVIAAAIAAAEGTTTDGFVVRSIRKVKRNRR